MENWENQLNIFWDIFEALEVHCIIFQTYMSLKESFIILGYEIRQFHIVKTINPNKFSRNQYSHSWIFFFHKNRLNVNKVNSNWHFIDGWLK